MEYHSNLLYRNVEDKGEIKDHPEALEEAFKASQELVDFEKGPSHVSEMMSVRATIEDTGKGVKSGGKGARRRLHQAST
jgi:hypothetical protein